MKLAQLKPATAKPTVVLKVGPEEFSSEWKGATNIAIGLRMLSFEEDRVAEKLADKRLRESLNEGRELDEALAERNSFILSWVVARGICDPNDRTKGHPAFEYAEDQVPRAFTSGAIARIFDELEKLRVETSPLFAEANDEDLAALSDFLGIKEPLVGFSPQKAARIRRYANFILREIASEL